AEDGIRDFHVTGVQTCALPILSHTRVGLGACATVAARSQPRFGGAYQNTASAWWADSARPSRWAPSFIELERGSITAMIWLSARSEERRVGKECRARWGLGGLE